MFFYSAELLVSHHRVESSHLHWWYYGDVCVKRKPSWVYPKKTSIGHQDSCSCHTSFRFAHRPRHLFGSRDFFSHELLGARNSVVLWMESRHACAKLSSSGGFRHVFFKHHHHHHHPHHHHHHNHHHHLETKHFIVEKSLQVGDVVFSKDVFLIWQDTSLKTNIEPKNEGLEDDFPLHLGDLFRFHLSFPGCTGIVYGWLILKRCSIKYRYFLLSDVQYTDTFPRCSFRSLHTFENDWSLISMFIYVHLCSSMFYFMTLWSTTLHCHVPLEAEYGSTSL